MSFLKGGAAPQRDYFYWELHEGASLQAVRFGDWKAVKNGLSAKTELYDLKGDVGERTNLATDRPELVTKAEAIFKSARIDHADWPLRDRPVGKAKQGKK